MQKGQIIIIALIFMLVILVLVGALMNFVIQNVNATRRAVAGEQALQLADAGIDKAVWQLNQTAGAYTGETNTAFGSGVFDVVVTSISGTEKEITSTGYVPNKTSPVVRRQVKANVTTSTTSVSFNYGVQVGDGGMVMNNNARVNGSVYSNGVIDGASGARITGTAYSAGATGRIFDRLQIDGSAYAHQIDTNVTIGGNAHGYTMNQLTIGGNVYTNSISNCTVGASVNYTSISNCTVGGTYNPGYPGDPDPAPLPFPISNSQIQDWKDQAATGGTITGSYTLTNGAAASLGPKKITGTLTLSNNAILTLTGPIWVVGDISVSNNAIIRLDPSYGNNSELLVADGTIQVSNNAIFQRAGPSSYIMMLTTNSSSSAFQVANNADALIVYAANGTATISNNAQLREVTAYRLVLQNNAVVTYESGLSNVNFTGGPGGSWQLMIGTWRQIE